MKKIRLIALITFLFSLPILACGDYSMFMGKHATAKYVGTIHTQAPESLGENDYKIEISFTGGEWSQNSAICFKKAKAEVVGTEIHLKIYTGLCNNKAPKEQAFTVKDLTAPDYDLVYIDPDGTKHNIGKITPK